MPPATVDPSSISGASTQPATEPESTSEVDATQLTASPHDVSLVQEMRESYLVYAMSVIVARALPDVRDGLKPVQRRILYAMQDQGMTPGASHQKCAAIVGEVLKNYHPHGDISVYDTLVRLAQPWVLRYPLVDGQGNFGSPEGDPAAAYRYTEARMTSIAAEMLADIDKDTVDFVDNYSGQRQEPVVLPSAMPNLLVNGASGIAVGMATSIPPHNLTEVCNGLVHMIDHPDATTEDLMRLIPGPDFPSGGIIYARDLAQVYGTGHGRVVQRARVIFEESKAGREQIIVTELPYQVNPSRVLQTIAELVNERKLEGIADLRNETGRREGTRLVIELKRDARPHTVLNNLYQHTQLQSTFSCIFLALVNGTPHILSLRQILHQYLEYRREIVERRTRHDLVKAKDRLHIVEGLLQALSHIDQVIKIIRAAADEATARQQLEAQLKLSERQSQAIVDMRLGRLTRLQRDQLDKEHKELVETIATLELILSSKERLVGVVREELTQLRQRYGNPRRTEIVSGEVKLEAETLIPDQSVVVSLTRRGYIKRTDISEYRTTKRGGKGVIAGKQVGEEDYITHLTTVSTQNDLLFFTDRGRVFRLRAYDVPAAARTTKGSAIINHIEIDPKETVTAMLPVATYSDDHYLLMATKKGQIKKSPMSAYSSVRRSGLNAIGLAPGDELGWVDISTGSDEVLLITCQGKAIRFSETNVRPMGREAQGVTAISLQDQDQVTGMSLAALDSDVLVVTQQAYGKLTPINDYPAKNRGGQGVYTIDYHALGKIGKIVGSGLLTSPDQEILLVTRKGQLLRLSGRDIKQAGRQTRGVILMRLNQGDEVVAIARADLPNSTSDD